MKRNLNTQNKRSIEKMFEKKLRNSVGFLRKTKKFQKRKKKASRFGFVRYSFLERRIVTELILNLRIISSKKTSWGIPVWLTRWLIFSRGAYKAVLSTGIFNIFILIFGLRKVLSRIYLHSVLKNALICHGTEFAENTLSNMGYNFGRRWINGFISNYKKLIKTILAKHSAKMTQEDSAFFFTLFLEKRSKRELQSELIPVGIIPGIMQRLEENLRYNTLLILNSFYTTYQSFLESKAKIYNIVKNKAWLVNYLQIPFNWVKSFINETNLLQYKKKKIISPIDLTNVLGLGF